MSIGNYRSVACQEWKSGHISDILLYLVKNFNIRTYAIPSVNSFASAVSQRKFLTTLQSTVNFWRINELFLVMIQHLSASLGKSAIDDLLLRVSGGFFGRTWEFAGGDSFQSPLFWCYCPNTALTDRRTWDDWHLKLGEMLWQRFCLSPEWLWYCTRVDLSQLIDKTLPFQIQWEYG